MPINQESSVVDEGVGFDWFMMPIESQIGSEKVQLGPEQRLQVLKQSTLGSGSLASLTQMGWHGSANLGLP